MRASTAGGYSGRVLRLVCAGMQRVAQRSLQQVHDIRSHARAVRKLRARLLVFGGVRTAHARRPATSV